MKKKKRNPVEFERQYREALECGRQDHAAYLERMRARYGAPLPVWIPIR